MRLKIFNNYITRYKGFFRQILNSKFVTYSFSGTNELKLACYPKVFAKSFGNDNLNKMFYVIWRRGGGAGFFSNLTFVLIHIKIAETLGMIPIVDFEHFPIYYNEDSSVDNLKNSWEYYFEQVSPYSLMEVYGSKHVFFCDGEFPWEYWDKNLRNKEFYQAYYKKYVKLKSVVYDKLEIYNDIFNERVLAVHFRGKEMNYAAEHYFAPTIKQMFKYTEMMLKQYNLTKIFIVTEEKHYLDAFRERYGDKLIFTDSFCIASINAYKLYPRSNHRYQLGLEILRDTLLLSRCNAILCSSSNVSETAMFLGNHEVSCFIDNGINSSNFFVSKFLYDIKKYLPHWCGGLKDKIIIREALK